MREITGDYAVPENACPSLRALYFGLEELEKDLHRHIISKTTCFSRKPSSSNKKYFRDIDILFSH